MPNAKDNSQRRQLDIQGELNHADAPSQILPMSAAGIALGTMYLAIGASMAALLLLWKGRSSLPNTVLAEREMDVAIV